MSFFREVLENSHRGRERDVLVIRWHFLASFELFLAKMCWLDVGFC
jgi:hypothetical protein